MENAKTTPKTKPTLKKPSAVKPRKKKHMVLRRAAMRKPLAHLFPGPDDQTGILCYLDPATGRYDVNCHPVDISKLPL
jgi:hypothetical protein